MQNNKATGAVTPQATPTPKEHAGQKCPHCGRTAPRHAINFCDHIATCARAKRVGNLHKETMKRLPKDPRPVDYSIAKYREALDKLAAEPEGATPTPTLEDIPGSDLLRGALYSAVRLAITRHNLELDKDAATEEEIAEDAAGACFGEECCEDIAIPEVTEILRRLAGEPEGADTGPTCALMW